MRLFRWRGTVLRQFWLWFVLVLLLNQVAVFTGIYFFLMKPAVDSFATLTTALIDAGYRQQLETPGKGLGMITDHWVSNDHVIIKPGATVNLQPIPPYPGLKLIQRGIQLLLGEQVTVGFQNVPEQTLWIQYQGARPFAVGIPMAERVQGLNLLLLAVFATLLLSSLAAWLIAAHLTRPLAHLSGMARRVGQGEKVGDIQVGDNSPTEVAQLASALNQMRQEIDQMQQERERFLAGIAHDLRTPLSRMRVALELNEAKHSALKEGLCDDIEEMRAILDQFIELSRLDTEQSETTQTGDLNELIASIAQKYQRAGETLILETTPLPPLRFKPLALTRLLYNLVDNALRYGEGVVAVQSRLSDAGQICLTVTNLHSEGVRDSALVEALRLLPNGQQSGLGWAIVRRLAEVHDAEVRILASSTGERIVEILFAPIL